MLTESLVRQQLQLQLLLVAVPATSLAAGVTPVTTA